MGVVVRSLADWRSALVIVEPETVINWRRKGSVSLGPGRFGMANRKARGIARSPGLDSNDES